MKHLLPELTPVPVNILWDETESTPGKTTPRPVIVFVELSKLVLDPLAVRLEKSHQNRKLLRRDITASSWDAEDLGDLERWVGAAVIRDDQVVVPSEEIFEGVSRT